MKEVIDLLLKLSSEIDTIKSYILTNSIQEVVPDRFDKVWIDGQDVMLSLHISKRTLQSLRDSGILPFSRINGKFFYKKSDIEALLVKNYSHNKLFKP